MVCMVGVEIGDDWGVGRHVGEEAGVHVSRSSRGGGWGTNKSTSLIASWAVNQPIFTKRQAFHSLRASGWASTSCGQLGVAGVYVSLDLCTERNRMSRASFVFDMMP